MTWSRTADGKSTCDVHGGEPFEPHKGGGCAACNANPGAVAVPLGEWEQLAAEAKRRGLPDILGYEQRFVAFADAAEQSHADAGLAPMERLKALDTAVKSLRAALEIARYRDDWSRIEYRERLKKLGRDGSGKKVEGN